MNVREVIALLQTCNPEARVTVSINHRLSEYTWDTDHIAVDGILVWPEPPENCNMVELTYEL